MSDVVMPREFSAERQLRQRQKERDLQSLASRAGPAEGGVGVGVALDPSGVSNAELLAAVNALRQEVRDLKQPDDEHPDADETMIDDNMVVDARYEIALMVRAIARAKMEIAMIRHPMGEEDRMDAASGELDAIVRATEVATNKILEANEKIEEQMNKISATHHGDEEVVVMVDHVAEAVINIFEACNFQDITGQRVTKVVSTIRYIEDRVRSMIDIWGVEAFAELPIPNDVQADPDADLMNGPQLEGQAITQDEIDALFD